MWSDFRFAARILRNSPLFAAGVMSLLALGIAANTVMFSLVDAMLLRPLPVRDADSLHRFVTIRPPLPARGDFERTEYEAWQKQLSGFRELIAWSELQVPLTISQLTERAQVDFVTGNYFTSLGVAPALGRLFTAEDLAEGTAPAILSYPYWQRRFGGDVHVLGKIIELDGRKIIIVGVSAKHFNGLTLETTPDLRLPLAWLKPLRPALGDINIRFEVAGRLRDGVSVEAARQEAESIWVATWKLMEPNDPLPTARFELQSASRGISRLRGSFGGVLWILMAGVLLLMLIVCANVAGLLIARAAGRQSELAVRTALGATRWQLVRQLLCEAVWLMLGGVIGAFVLSFAAIPIIARALPPVRDLGTTRLDLSLDLMPDLRVAGFAIAISAVTLLLFGLLPALTATRYDLHPLLKEARGGGGWRGRQLLIALQVALCTMLLSGAGLTLRTLQRLAGMNPGFDASRIVTFTVNTDAAKYTDEQAEALQRRLLEGARALPDVASAAMSNLGLMRGSGRKMTVLPAGQIASKDSFLNTSLLSVSPEYFETMRIRWLAGRNFTGHEDPAAKPAPVIVNEAFLKFHKKFSDVFHTRFGSASVNGKPAKPDFEVIGIVNDTKYRSLREPFQPILYGLAGPGTGFVLQIRTRSTSPESVIPAMRRMLADFDPRLSFVETATLSSEVAASLWPERVTAFLASIFAVAAALIAGAGLYALIAFAVLQRRREIGIRMALGAMPTDILRLTMSRAVWLSGVGVAMGLGCAWAAAPRIAAVLYEVQPRDPSVLVASGTLALLVTLCAALIPSVRATRLHPASILRRE